MLDNFREWLSDNLRYILLGLAAILLVVIAFFAVRLIRGIGSPEEKETEAQQMTESVTEAAPKDTENKMIKEPADSPISKFIVQYYTTLTAKDYDALASCFEDYTEEDKAEAQKDSVIESYNNISVYSKNGVEDGSYIVYTYFDAKITGIATTAPCLRELYLATDAEGKFVISDPEGSQARIDYLLEMRTDADVQALIHDVKDLMTAAQEQDADLAAYVESLSAGGGQTDGTTDAEGGDGTTAVTGAMQATTDVNVRGADSTDATLYGTVMTGTQVEVLENLDSGWSKIRYTVNGTTIEGYVMTQYLGPIG